MIAALKPYRPTVGTAPQEFVQRASVVAWDDERHVEETRARYAREARACCCPSLEREGLGGRRERRDDVPLARGPAMSRRRRSPSGCSSAACIVSPGYVLRPERRGLRPLRARADARGVRARGRDPRRRLVTTEETIAALDRGEMRVAEKVDGEWRVNEDAKAAILDYFRIREMEPIEVGPFEYHDKIPLKRDYERARRARRAAGDGALRLVPLARAS